MQNWFCMTEGSRQALLEAAIAHAEDPDSLVKEQTLVAAARAVGYEREKMQLLADQTRLLQQRAKTLPGRCSGCGARLGVGRDENPADWGRCRECL